MKTLLLILLVLLLSVLVSCMAQSASAQEAYPTPTPLPQVIATQQAAAASNQQVNDLQAQRAQVEAKLSEINRNIEAQIAAAAQAAADARNAAATQNAVEAGAAIGRLEGAIAQLRDSYAGKDAIISDLQSRNEQQAAQSATDKRTIDSLTTKLQQAQRDSQNIAASLVTLRNQRAQDEKTSAVGNIVAAFEFIVVFVLILSFGAYVVSRRRQGVTITTATAQIIEPEDSGDEADDEVN